MDSQITEALPIKAQGGERLGPANCSACGGNALKFSGENQQPDWVCPECGGSGINSKIPPCLECGAMTEIEAETKCNCGGDKDHCHGCELWP